MQNAKCKIKNFGWVGWVVLGRLGNLFFQTTQTTQSTQSTHFTPNALNDLNDPNDPNKQKKATPSGDPKIDFRRGFARLGKIYRRWVVLIVLPIGGNFVSRSKDLIKSILQKIAF